MRRHIRVLGYIGDMYVILFYDAGEKRVCKIMKVCREYLVHVQNSVFEGEITEANLVGLKQRITQIIDKDYDSVIIYVFKFLDAKYVSRDILGVEKVSTDFIY